MLRSICNIKWTISSQI